MSFCGTWTTKLRAAQQYLRDSICEQTYQPFAKILLPQLTSDHHFSTHPALISSYFNRGVVACISSIKILNRDGVCENKMKQPFSKLKGFLSALKWIKELKVIFEGFYNDLFSFYKMLNDVSQNKYSWIFNKLHRYGKSVFLNVSVLSIATVWCVIFFRGFLIETSYKVWMNTCVLNHV